jgi:hypothetical protein
MPADLLVTKTTSSPGLHHAATGSAGAVAPERTEEDGSWMRILAIDQAHGRRYPMAAADEQGRRTHPLTASPFFSPPASCLSLTQVPPDLNLFLFPMVAIS